MVNNVNTEPDHRHVVSVYLTASHCQHGCSVKILMAEIDWSIGKEKRLQTTKNKQ